MPSDHGSGDRTQHEVECIDVHMPFPLNRKPVRGDRILLCRGIRLDCELRTRRQGLRHAILYRASPARILSLCSFWPKAIARIGRVH